MRKVVLWADADGVESQRAEATAILRKAANYEFGGDRGSFDAVLFAAMTLTKREAARLGCNFSLHDRQKYPALTDYNAVLARLVSGFDSEGVSR